MRVFARIQAFCLGASGRLGGAGGSVHPSGAASVLSRSLALTEALDAVEVASIIPRSPDDEGPRTFVRCAGLGAFVYSGEETERRVRRKFPELRDDEVTRVVKRLAARVMLKTRGHQPDMAEVVRARRRHRENWTHGWAVDDTPPPTSNRDIDSTGWLAGRW